MVLEGAGWNSISSLVFGEIVVGAIYILIGYVFFLFLEKRSMISGNLDAM
jgi:hypothetical protein